MSRPDVLVAGRYRLVERIASGGMGSVWEGWDERLQRRVAVKQLHPQPGLSPAEAELATNRAMREARITARLHHAHAVPVYDVVDHEGQPCLIMQYLPSRSLQAVLSERGSLSGAEVVQIGSEIASALAAAHLAGIVHRDVKPGNVLIADDGSAKLTDFGISRALGDATLTSAGMVTGTPAYLAPEVARGLESRFASDVFSLGSTLYAALEGSPPFGTGDNPMATLHRVSSGAITPMSHRGALTPLLERMLTTDPAQRPSMAEVAAELASLRSGSTGATQRLAAAAAAPTVEQPVTPAPRTVSLPAVAPTAAAAAPPPRVVRTESPAPDPDRSSDRRSGPIIAAVALALLLVGGLVVFLLSRSDSPATNAATGSSPASSPTRSTPSSSAKASPTARRSSSSASTSAKSTPPKSSASKSSSSSSKPSGTPTAGELSAAISNYYGLLPGNTDAGWSRLTPSFQQNKAQGRANYDQFWGGISSVSATNVSGSPPNTASATITYVRKDGSRSVENTTFTLVRQDGILKIDGSQVTG